MYNKILNNIVEEAAISKVGYAVNSYQQLNAREIQYLLKVGSGHFETEIKNNKEDYC